MADIKILNTSHGNLLKNVIENLGDNSVSLSLRYSGIINPDGTVDIKKLYTIDVVSDTFESKRKFRQRKLERILKDEL